MESGVDEGILLSMAIASWRDWCRSVSKVWREILAARDDEKAWRDVLGRGCVPVRCKMGRAHHRRVGTISSAVLFIEGRERRRLHIQVEERVVMARQVRVEMR